MALKYTHMAMRTFALGQLILALVSVALLRVTSLATLILAIPTQASNIPERISFQNIVENKDFSIGEGSAFLQDSQGFMWLGGGIALIRYDGYEFRQFDFMVDENKPNEKYHPHVVNHIYEDSHQTLWIATRGGVLRYDPRTEALIKVKDDESQALKISSQEASRVQELPSGEILVSSLAGLFIIDPLTNKYQTITPDNKKKNWLRAPQILSMYLAPDGTLWLGTNMGLERVDWKEKIFTPVQFNPDEPESKLFKRVSYIRDIVADGEGKFWLATSGGLVRFDPNTHQVTGYENNPNDRYSLGGNDIWKLLIDSEGLLWIASDGGGVSVFDRKKNRFINYQAEPGRADALNTNKVRTLYEDRNGDIWVGNFPVGVNFYDRSTAPITTYTANAANPNSLSNNSVLSVSEDKDGNLWLGTDGGGLNFFDREKNEFTHFKSDPNDPTTLNGDSVLTTFIDTNGLVWVGTWGKGLASYNPAEKKFTHYPFSEDPALTTNGGTSATLNNPTVWSIKEDKDHNLWIGTLYGGVSKFNPQTKLFTHYRPVNNDPSALTSDLVWRTLDDSQGDIWVATANGLNLMNKNKGTFTSFFANPNEPNALSNSNILSIFEDSDHRLWLGSDSGLNLYDRKTQKFTAYTKSSGFFNDSIHDIVEDLDGILWVSTANGFSSFNPDTKKIKNYTRIGGRLIGGFGINSGALSSRGEVIFGGAEGLRVFNPKELKENTKAPPIALTDFKIFSDSVMPGGADGLLHSVINHTNTITLDYTKSMFTVSFAALNYRDTGKNQYSYKLEGFDEEWINAGNQRNAKYTNLDAGTYVFRVKGSNNDGLWNDAGKSVTIIQLPPPWKTWWAYIIYTTLVIGLLLLLMLNQRQKLQVARNISRELEHKVAERTAELQLKNTELESAYSQLESISLSDPLTGLNNRRYLQKLLPMDIAKVQREYAPPSPNSQPRQNMRDLTFFILDVDFFKSVNDVYGHTAGDQLLIQLSSVLSKICRESDCVVRWGGEEFLIVSRFADREEGPLMAERIRNSIEQYNFALPDGSILKKTCSIGFASFPFVPMQPTILSWEQVIDVADRALYAAKKSGRNRCVGLAANASTVINTNKDRLYLRISSNLPAMIVNKELTVITATDKQLVWD